MRIGIITGEYPPMQGGVGAYSRIIAKTLVEQGHDVFVLSNNTTRETNPSITLSNTIKKWNLVSLRAVRRWVLANQLDVVNLQYQTAAFDMSPWIHFLPNYLHGIPFVTTFHDLLFPYLSPKAGPLRDWIVMRLARTSAGVIATNQEDMLRLQHLPYSRLIPIGSNILTDLPDDFDKKKLRESVGAAEEDFIMAHFGFMNRSKGIETLLLAMSKLRDKGFPVRLVMIGGRTGSSDPTNAAYADEIDALIDKLNLNDFIHWTGFVGDEQVTSCFAISDAVVLPFSDGISYRRGSLMAAIQHGCAIVSTQPKLDIPIFVHGENMLLFPISDVDTLVKQMKSLMADPVQRERLREGALELSGHFDWDEITRECLSLFEEVSETA